MATSTKTRTNDKTTVVTANGMPTNASSTNANVDLFFQIGSARTHSVETEFRAALAENQDMAIRILLWARDIRGGAGERQTFRNLMTIAMESFNGDKTLINRFVDKVVEIGRWDDLIALFFNTDFEYYALCKIRHGLMTENNELCAKWMPRPKGSKEASKIRRFLKMTPKAYRKLISSMSPTVEQLMCAKKWDQIDYAKLPSVAQARYSKAFHRNDGERYREFLDSLEKGETTVNAGAVYPYDIVKTATKGGQAALADNQWLALPNYCEGSTERVLPMVDVSYSMNQTVGGNKNLNCMDVAVSLGLYLAERCEGHYHNRFLTFSSSPTMQTVRGATLKDRVDNMSNAEWGMSTNIEAAFMLLLDSAKKYSVDSSEMPTQILILSDMEFDRCVDGVGAFAMIKERYETAGYTMPQIVFWNLAAKTGNVPVNAHQSGSALVSGFSPSIMKSLLGSEDMSPAKIMMDAVMVDRYDILSQSAGK